MYHQPTKNTCVPCNRKFINASGKAIIFLVLFLCTGFFSCGDAESTPETSAPPVAKRPQPVQPTENILTGEEQAAGWKLLFDGKSTNQWRGYNSDTFPAQGWQVTPDGTLAIGTRTGAGDIITKEKYGDFELTIDFMLSDTGNSGIFYRAIEQPNIPIWHNAPEYQLLDDAIYFHLERIDKDQRTGAAYEIAAPRLYQAKAPGSWNTARIVAKGNLIEHYLNDSRVARYTIGSKNWNEAVAASKFKDYPAFGKARTGHIGLQDHDRLTQFRNIKIRAL